MVFCLLIGGRNASAGTLHFHIGADGIRLAAHDHLFCAAVYANEWNADELSPDAQARYEAIDQDALLALAASGAPVLPFLPPGAPVVA